MSKYSNKHVGFVALGGNRNTCYFQIEGVGCRTVLEHTSLFRLHWWLDLLGCSRLSRIDLAVDDFHGLFGREYAKKAIPMMPFAPLERDVLLTVVSD